LQNTFTKFGKTQMMQENVIPHEFMYKMLLSGVLEEYYEIDLKGCCGSRKTYQLSVQDGKIVLWEIFSSYVIKGFKSLYDEIWNRVHDRIGILKILLTGWIFPNRRWYSRRFPNLCGSNVVPRYGNARNTILELFLPNFRFNYQLRFVFWSCSE
jgi:hypothetical protein